MKHLFFVSVAAGIFSATPISATAQTSLNSTKFTVPQKKLVQFIEGIEIKREVTKPAEVVDLWAIPVKKAPVVDEQDVVLSAPEKRARTTAAGNTSIENCLQLQFKYAQLMETEVETITNTKLYEAIDNWWATRYRYGGTTKNGIDCSALTGALLREGYGVTPDRTARAQYAQSQKLAVIICRKAI
jgi:cell wall-associated NlpC family hydrolase